MIKIVQSSNTMEPITGTIRQGLHAALDDLMDDVERQSGAVTGGLSELCAEKEGYRHTLTLIVNIVTEPLSDPSLN